MNVCNVHPALAEPIGATRLRRKRKLDAFAALVPLRPLRRALKRAARSAVEASHGGGVPTPVRPAGPESMRDPPRRWTRSTRLPTSRFPPAIRPAVIDQRFDVKLGSVSPGPRVVVKTAMARTTKMIAAPFSVPI